MDPIGIAAIVAVLVVGTTAGIWRARTNGRLRDVRGAESAPVGERPDVGEGPERLDPALLAGLGVEPGARGTLLQFSSAYCAPCRAVRRVSAEVADEISGVRHVEVDAEAHLDAVRALGIWRTPTLLVLDGQGRVTKRATGVPTKPNLIAALEG